MAWIQRLERKRGTVSYKVYWRDPMKKIKTKTFGKKRDADRQVRDVEVKKDTGTYFDPNLGKVTVATFWKHFIRTSPPASPSTLSLYELQARRYILPQLGGLQLREISKPAVKEFLADLRDDGLGPASVHSVYRLLRRVLTVAVDEDRIPRNPASRLDVPRPARTEMQFLTQHEVALLAHKVPERYEALIYFLSYTGARIGEAAALRVKNVDLLNRQVRIVEASKEVDGKLHLGPTKNRQNRALTLPGFLVDMLTVHLATFSSPADPEALVFSGPNGLPIRQGNFRQRVFKPAATRAGLPTAVRPHDLRHTACAIAIAAGWHAKKIQEMLGHSSIEVTMGTYGHLFETLHADAADLLDASYTASLEAKGAQVVALRAPARTASDRNSTGREAVPEASGS